MVVVNCVALLSRQRYGVNDTVVILNRADADWRLQRRSARLVAKEIYYSRTAKQLILYEDNNFTTYQLRAGRHLGSTTDAAEVDV